MGSISNCAIKKVTPNSMLHEKRKLTYEQARRCFFLYKRSILSRQKLWSEYNYLSISVITSPYQMNERRGCVCYVKRRHFCYSISPSSKIIVPFLPEYILLL